MRTEALMQRGNKLMRQGAFPAAAECFAKLARLQPGNLDAIFNQGLALQTVQRLEEAVACYDRVLALHLGHQAALTNRGIALKNLGRLEQALASFERSLALNPRQVGALIGQGLVLEATGYPQQALISYERALQLSPDHAGALNNRGKVLAGLDRLEEALACYDHLLRVVPRNADVLANRALVLKKLDRGQEALAGFDAALAIDPRHRAALNGRGLSLGLVGEYELAVAHFRHWLSFAPGEPDASINLGACLLELGRAEEALAVYQELRARDPHHLLAMNKVGAALLQLNRPEEALVICQELIARQPQQADIWCNIGATFDRAGYLEQARRHYEQALALDPGHPQSLHNLCLVRLAQGELAEGFRAQEVRWKTPSLKHSRPATAAPLWLGDAPLGGKRILLCHEQGFGDTLQFVRYAPMVAALGAEVSVVVPRPLQRLIAGMRAPLQVVAHGELLPAHDFYCPMMSLPLAFGTTLESIPAQIPYLWPDPERVTHWDARLGPRTQLRVGLSWAGRQYPPINFPRDMPLAALQPLLLQRAQFVSLQKEIPAHERALFESLPIAGFGEELEDFADTAALAASLDLLIAVDSAVAHVGAAIGRPVWIPNRYAPCWRWLRGRDDSPWYPTVRLFRQPRFGDWTGTVARIDSALGEFLHSVQKMS